MRMVLLMASVKFLEKITGPYPSYLVSFKLPFITYQSNIRYLWVTPQVLIGSGSILEVVQPKFCVYYWITSNLPIFSRIFEAKS